MLAHLLSDFVASEDQRAVGGFVLAAGAVLVWKLKRRFVGRAKPWRYQRHYESSPAWRIVAIAFVLGGLALLGNAASEGEAVADTGVGPGAEVGR